MKITKQTVDRGATVVSAVASAVLPLLVAAGDISPDHAGAIGAGVAAFVVAYHSGAAAQNSLPQSSPVAPTVAPATPGVATGATGDPTLEHLS